MKRILGLFLLLSLNPASGEIFFEAGLGYAHILEAEFYDVPEPISVTQDTDLLVPFLKVGTSLIPRVDLTFGYYYFGDIQAEVIYSVIPYIPPGPIFHSLSTLTYSGESHVLSVEPTFTLFKSFRTRVWVSAGLCYVYTDSKVLLDGSPFEDALFSPFLGLSESSWDGMVSMGMTFRLSQNMLSDVSMKYMGLNSSWDRKAAFFGGSVRYEF